MLLEKNVRLAHSILWRLQQQAYEQFGPAAWSQQGVPSYLTSNPLTAKYYAHIALAYLRDNADALEWNEPFYCFDLGAGTGKFAYLFLKEFLPLLSCTPFGNKLSFRYIMTDIAEKNRSFWSSHPLLSCYFSQGILERCAYCHGDTSSVLYLENSGRYLDLSMQTNPYILIANYFFDTIPQDFFRIVKGALYEGLVTVATEGNKAEKKPDPLCIPSLKLSWDYRLLMPEEVERYYSNESCQQMLKNYLMATFEEGLFLFPSAAFCSLDFFHRCSGGQFLLLAGDQAVVTQEQVRAAGEPYLSLHGSFSLPVNYHALAAYCQMKGGQSFLTSLPDPIFATIAAAFGRKNVVFPETQMAFKAHLDAFQIKDYWILVEEGRRHCSPSLDEIFLWIKLGNWDPTNVYTFFSAIKGAIASARPEQRAALLLMIERVYSNFFLVENSDAVFILNLGVLCFELRHYQRALFYFEEAQKYLGEEELLLKGNIAACYRALKMHTELAE